MSDFDIREYRAEDIPALSRLWEKTFEDSPALIADFFRLLPDMGTGLAAVQKGEIVGAAYVIMGMELLNGEEKPVPGGYIYAVAVEERCRGFGIGSALTRAARDEGLRRGAAFVCTLPASESLYGWYRELLGVEPALFRSTFQADCAAREPVMPLSVTEYMLWRENILQGQTHLHLSYPALEFQHRLCKAYGGGFYAVGSGVCAAYLDGETALIRELLLMDEREKSSAAASVGAEMGAKDFILYSPAPEGEPYIAALPGAIPTGCVWNLSFD